MMWTNKSLLCLLCLLCFLDDGISFPANPEQHYSSCDAPETVLEGDRASITCHFNRPDNFIVYRLPSIDGGKRTIPAVCSLEGDRRKCDTLDGYNVTTTKSRDQSTVEIHIHSARLEHSGQYFCKTLPAAKDNATGCTLTVQSNKVRQQNLVTCRTGSPLQVGQEASVACEFSKSVGRTGITLTKHGPNPEEIMRCDRQRRCNVKKKGFSIAEQTDTLVRVSILSATSDDVGVYTCSSAILKNAHGICTLGLPPGQGGTDSRTEDRETTILYVILAVVGLVAAAILGVVVYALCFRVRGGPSPPKCLAVMKKHLLVCTGDNRRENPESSPDTHNHLLQAHQQS